MTYCQNFRRVFYRALEQNVFIVYALLSSCMLAKWVCTAVLQGPGCTLSCPVTWLCCSTKGWSECPTHLPMNILTCNSYVISVLKMVGLLWENTSHNIQFTKRKYIHRISRDNSSFQPENADYKHQGQITILAW